MTLQNSDMSGYKNLKSSNINISTVIKQCSSEDILKAEIMSFIQKYGLPRFMTALPTTPEFITYEAVCLSLNHFIKKKSMTTKEYTYHFFLFELISFVKKSENPTGRSHILI